MKKKAKIATKKTVKKAARKKIVAKAKKKIKVETSSFMKNNDDPAHSPGHRRINVKDNFTAKRGHKTEQQDSAVNQMSRSEQIRRTSKTNRRIITGAAMGKTGRIITEKV